MCRGLGELAQVLEAEEDLRDILQRTVDQVVRAVPDADMVSVTVLSNSIPETVASSSDRMLAIDSRLPCWQAATAGGEAR